MSDSSYVRYIGDAAVKITYHVATGSKPSSLEFAPGQEREVSADIAAWLVGGSFPNKFVACSGKAEKAAVEVAAKAK